MSLSRVNRLLKPRDYRRILRALEKVCDTFFDTPITIYRATDSIDRFNEDRADEVYIEYHLNCLFEFKSQEQIQVNQPGYTEQYDVKCTMYYKDCIAVGREKVNETILNQANDYYVVNGKK